MSTVLSGMQGLKCLVYLDDIIVYAETLQLHNDKLTEVFARLRFHNLKLQPDKCEFLRKEFTYLGHKLSAHGLRPDPEKISAVMKFPTPINTREIKQYLGLCSYYRKFIPNFSKIAKPLTELLKKNAPFEWNQRAEDAFVSLKEILTTEPLLQYPDFSKPFVLTTDARSEALGAILKPRPFWARSANCLCEQNA